MDGLIKFMETGAGRIARIVLGIALLAAGFGLIGGTWGAAIGIIGLAPIAFGLWGPCMVGLLTGRSRIKHV